MERLCRFSSLAARLETCIEKLEAGNPAAKYAETVAMLQELHDKHTKANAQFARAQLEHYKLRLCNPHIDSAYGVQPLRTSAYSAGDLVQMREIPKKKPKKKATLKRKRT